MGSVVVPNVASESEGYARSFPEVEVTAKHQPSEFREAIDEHNRRYETDATDRAVR